MMLGSGDPKIFQVVCGGGCLSLWPALVIRISSFWMNPHTGLDPASRRQVWEVIEAVKEGRSVVREWRWGGGGGGGDYMTWVSSGLFVGGGGGLGIKCLLCS